MLTVEKSILLTLIAVDVMLLRIVKKKLEKTFQSELESKCDSVLNMNVHILLDGS